MRVFDITLYLLFSSPGAPDSCRDQCETDEIRLVTLERINFAELSFSGTLLRGCLIVEARVARLIALVSPIIWVCELLSRRTAFLLLHHMVYSFYSNSLNLLRIPWDLQEA